MRTNIAYRLLMATLAILIGVVIPLTPAMAYATGDGNIDIAPIEDKFDDFKNNSNTKDQKQINDENTKVDKSEQKKQQQQNKKEEKKNNPGAWDVIKFLAKDYITDTAAAVKPHIYNKQIYDIDTRSLGTPTPNDVLYTSLVKLPRSIVGNLVFQEGSIVKAFIDLWDGTEKTKDAWNGFKTLREIKRLKNAYDSAGTFIQKLEIEKKLGSLKTVSKFGKGVGYAGLTISTIDAGKNLWDAFQADNPKDRNKALLKSVGSIGEMLISGGQILGPTPHGITIMAIGTVLWVGSAVILNWDGIKKGISKAVDTVVSTGKKAINGIKNGVKSAWNKIFG